MRSEARFVISEDANVTGGTGFVAALSLMSKFGAAAGKRGEGGL